MIALLPVSANAPAGTRRTGHEQRCSMASLLSSLPLPYLQKRARSVREAGVLIQSVLAAWDG